MSPGTRTESNASDHPDTKTLPRTVLVVDDDSDFLEILGNALEYMGVQDVIRAKDGREALRVRDERKPDVVLLDHMMPGLAGSEVAALMRRSDERQIIILVSASDSTETLARDAGLKHWLQKPFGFVELRDTLDEAFRAL